MLGRFGSGFRNIWYCSRLCSRRNLQVMSAFQVSHLSAANPMWQFTPAHRGRSCWTPLVHRGCWTSLGPVLEMKRILTMLTLFTSLALCGCNPSGISLAGKWEYSEVSRIKSPDPKVEAVLLKGDAGATTATTYSLYLVPSGKRADPKSTNENRACFVADHIKNLNMVWKKSRLLQIQYEEARIIHFENLWQHRDVQDFHYVVELRLVPTTNEFSLPERDRYW